MRTLSDAWVWYQATKQSLELVRRLGERHWDDESLGGASIWMDERFKHVEAKDLVQDSGTSLMHIDDLAIVVMFSVFELQVRDHLIDRMTPHANSISDPILRDAAGDALDGIREGSFYRRVLEPLKSQHRVSADLTTQVDQIRDYRNWVAHGRREAPINNVTPDLAFDRLSEFLAELGIAVESELRDK